MTNKIIFFILSVIFICVFLLLQYYVRKKFYKKEFLNQSNEWGRANNWFDKKFQLTLFFPQVSLSKKNFWKGYLLYLLSILSLILALVIFYIGLSIKPPL